MLYIVSEDIYPLFIDYAYVKFCKMLYDVNGCLHNFFGCLHVIKSE